MLSAGSISFSSQPRSAILHFPNEKNKLRDVRFIHLSNIYCVPTSHVPNISLSTESTMLSKTNVAPALTELTV